MGVKLKSYYDQAAALGGLKAQMRLAVLTKVPSKQAESNPDTPESIANFEKAMLEIKKEFN